MNLTTLRIENHKDFDREIELITQLENQDSIVVHVIDNPRVKAILQKKGPEISLSTSEHLVSDDDDVIKDLAIQINNRDHIIKRCEFTSSSTSIQEHTGFSFSAIYSIRSIQSSGFKENAIFRSFFPVDLGAIKSFHDVFETVTYQRNEREYFYDCIRIEIDNKQFDITQFKTDKQGYYVIESFCEEGFEHFRTYCFVIRQTIGYMSGLMVGGEEYIFSEQKEMYYSNYLRPSIKAMYAPIVTNPYSKLELDNDISQQYYNVLTRISPKVLSNLAARIKDKRELSASIILLLESTSIKSLLVIPSIFSVIIESLTKLISVPETGQEYPITDNTLKKEIVDALTNELERYSAKLSDQSILKLKRRILEINRPVVKNHLTNNEKLTQPFEQLGIQLSLHDISIIEHRNDLLHGNILLIDEGEESKRDTDAYMNYVSCKLYTLISKLILKYVGYTGYIYNHAKYMEKHIGITTDEEYFDMI